MRLRGRSRGAGGCLTQLPHETTHVPMHSDTLLDIRIGMFLLHTHSVTFNLMPAHSGQFALCTQAKITARPIRSDILLSATPIEPVYSQGTLCILANNEAVYE